MLRNSHQRLKYGGAVGLLLILAVFILAKIHDLSLPYFWDELGVYAPGALNMNDTGHFGLMPSCMEPELSRGHPLLAYLGYALAYRCFGDSTVTGHACSLFLACATLLATYRLARAALSRASSLAVCALLAVQPLFFTMAGIVMPEMMLTLFTILALLGLLEARWWLYLLSASACVLVKEAGLVVPAAAVAFIGLKALMSRELFTLRVGRQLLLSLLPLAVFAAFLVVQKQLRGWYLFPLHTHLMLHDPAAILQRAKGIAYFVFWAQGRGLLFLFFCGGVATAAIRRQDGAVPDAVLLALLLILAALGFAAPNYFLVRYILYALPFSLLLGVWGLNRLSAWVSARYRPALVVVCTAAGVLVAASRLYPPRFADCADMSYKFLVLTERACINWAEKQPWRDSAVTANFPVIPAVGDRRYGYLGTRASWRAIYSDSGVQRTRYGIYYWLGGKPPVLKPGRFSELKRFRQHDAVFSVMARVE